MKNNFFVRKYKTFFLEFDKIVCFYVLGLKIKIFPSIHFSSSSSTSSSSFSSTILDLTLYQSHQNNQSYFGLPLDFFDDYRQASGEKQQNHKQSKLEIQSELMKKLKRILKNNVFSKIFFFLFSNFETNNRKVFVLF